MMECMKYAISLCLFLAACGGVADDESLELETTYEPPADAGAPAPAVEAPAPEPDAGPARECQTITYNLVTGYSSAWGPCP
jgi:hypothetical protein